jgi:hypothetical protein
MPSQHGQDLFVLDVLGGRRGGFFLDSGAADGVAVSNTLLLETAFGWDGICVEPNDRFFAALVRNRRCRCVHCCLYDREGDVEFVEDCGTLGGILDEYAPSLLRFAKRTHGLAEGVDGRPPTVLKPARSTRSVLAECAAPPVIDYWSLDTEGSELAILRGFPWDSYACRIITVEHNRLPVRDDIRRLLESLGYRCAATFDIDDAYVRDDLVARPAWRSNAWSRRLRRR